MRESPQKAVHPRQFHPKVGGDLAVADRLFLCHHMLQAAKSIYDTVVGLAREHDF
jgi:hypothetical protein